MTSEDKSCRHKYETIEEYTSTGKNLIGKMVKAKMAIVKCEKCNEDNIRFVQAL